MSRQVRFNRLARSDLDAIADYTEREWGKEQARTYLSDIATAIDRLALHPGLGSESESVRKGYRKLNVGSHRVYYRHQGMDIEIMRVLHERMDVEGRI